ncbi:MAG: YggT family protein [Actinomycetota bacterium]|jgi:YggT family protein|nr:YggT family protein [Actinomycetota bacterium]
MISTALQLYWYVLVLYVIFSWVPRPPDALRPFVVGVGRLVEPLATPLRRMIPPLRIGMVALDLSILVLLIGTSLLRNIAFSAGL